MSQVKVRAPVILWAAVLVMSAAVRVVFGPVEEYIATLSPISIWQLTSAAWFAIVATLSAAIFAWIVAVTLGAFLGMFTAAAEIARKEQGLVWRFWGWSASLARKLFTWLYVVPLVLTITTVTTVLLKFEYAAQLSPSIVGLVLIAVSGFALAGQRIFITIDEASANASSDKIFLASSLYLGAEPTNRRWLRIARRSWRETRFLVACRIDLMTEALEQAFHLAVVGVVILETVSGLLIYEPVFPQLTGKLTWGGGIGRIILDGQNGLNPTTVAGAVWLILLTDLMIASLIRYATRRKWVKPYRKTL
jgi:hypothetical protein